MALSFLKQLFLYFTLESSSLYFHGPHWPHPNIWTKASVQVVKSGHINVTLGTAIQTSHSSPGAQTHDTKNKSHASWKRCGSPPLLGIWLLWPYERSGPTKHLAFQLPCHKPHPSTPTHTHPHSPPTPHTINMGKEPPMKRQGIRYGPYSGSFLTRRGRGSTPPDSRGIRAGSRRAQLNGSISDLLEDVNTRCGGRDLREVFRGHANQPGALGQAIKTWIQYDEVIILLTSSLL